jgi:ketosteroid isomerase-like protein
MPEKSTTPDLLELAGHFVEASNRLDFDAMTSFYVEDAVFAMSALALEAVGL